MPLLVHITPDNKANALRRNGISPTRLRPDAQRHPEFDRVVWAFPVLLSYVLTHSWSRELKRWGATALAAVTFRVTDREAVFIRHFSEMARLMSAAEAVGLIAAMDDPRGFEIMVPRRIAPREIARVRTLSKAVGWRYWPGAKGRAMTTCDCPVCMPQGEALPRADSQAHGRARPAGLAAVAAGISSPRTATGRAGVARRTISRDPG